MTILGTGLVALAYASAFFPGSLARLGPWLLALGTAALVVGLMAMGAGRRGQKLGVLRWILGFTFVALAGGLGLALFLPANEGPGSALLGGLPLRAALVIYGVGLLPALILPIGYALTFRERTLDAEAVERIRALRGPKQDSPGDELPPA